MNLDTGQLDLNLAVTAFKTLWLEARTYQERFDLVWQPTQTLLDKLSSKPPPTLTCFAGKYYMFPANSNGVAVNLFFIEGNNVEYLGTLFDQTANRLDRAAEINRLKRVNQDLAQRLAKASPKAIIRDAHFFKLPADSNELDTLTATKAVKRYLAIRAPALAQCAVEWLPHEQGIALEERIRALAEQDATQPTKGDLLRAVYQDELELWS